MDRFDQIETFARVYETQSVSGASELLHLSKSAVSRRIKELEERLGVQLFHHKPRELIPTESGEHYYRRAMGILGQLADLEQDIVENEGVVRGRVRIAAPHAFGMRYISEPLLDLAEEYPDLHIEAHFEDRHVDLSREGYDLALRVSNLETTAADWKVRRLAAIRHYACASPDFWNEHGRPEHPDDLVDLPLLQYPQFAPRCVLSYEGPEGERGELLANPTMTANTGDFLLGAALRGLGYVVDPEFLIVEEVEDGALEVVLDEYTWANLKVWVLLPPIEHLPTRVRVVVDALAEALGPAPWTLGATR